MYRDIKPSDILLQTVINNTTFLTSFIKNVDYLSPTIKQSVTPPSFANQRTVVVIFLSLILSYFVLMAYGVTYMAMSTSAGKLFTYNGQTYMATLIVTSSTYSGAKPVTIPSKVFLTI